MTKFEAILQQAIKDKAEKTARRKQVIQDRRDQIALGLVAVDLMTTQGRGQNRTYEEALEKARELKEAGFILQS